MKSSLFASFAAASVLALALPAAAHTRLVNPTPLSPDDGAKSGPCGCFFGSPQDPADDASPVACPEDFMTTTLQAGTELTVEWQETVNHDGSFRIAFSPKPPQEVTKAEMDAAALPEIPDTNSTANAMISQKVTIPNEPCELCTLQVRQLMMGSANPYYYTCAAIRIVAADPTTSSTTTTGAGGAPGVGGAGPDEGGGGGQGGTTGAGMADPQPIVAQSCSAGSGPLPGGGALAIVGLSLAAELLRRRRRG